jgi:FAD/FMN-containing dehydrogenase
VVEALATPTAAQLAGLRRHFGGDVIDPADPGYDDARKVWNALHDRRPGVVVRPTSVADVQEAMRFATDSGIGLAVRGGGHSAAGHGTCDGGLLIDLGRLNAVSVDPERRTAVVGGGALLSQLDKAAQAHGLVCPTGVIGHTGVGGLTLGGGIGRLQRRFGLSIDNLRSVELVTADGRLIRASEDDEPDLFWGMRGAGMNFGIVTEFEFALQPYDGRLARGLRMYEARHVAEAWEGFSAFALTAPDAISTTFGAGLAVPESDYPESIAGKPIAFIAFSHSGDPADVERDLAPLAGLPKPAVEILAPVSYLEIQAANDEAMAWGRRSYLDGRFSNGLRAETLERVMDHIAGAPGDAGIGMGAFTGALSRVPDDAYAFPPKSAFNMSADAGSWDDPADDDRLIGWARTAMAILERDATIGRYIGEVTDTGDDMARSIYGDAKFERLQALKREWDPANLFRTNHNIAPQPAT